MITDSLQSFQNDKIRMFQMTQNNSTDIGECSEIKMPKVGKKLGKGDVALSNVTMTKFTKAEQTCGEQGAQSFCFTHLLDTETCYVDC